MEPNQIKLIVYLMGVLAKGRKSVGIGESYQLREPAVPYGVHFEAKKNDIQPENTYFWDVNL